MKAVIQRVISASVEVDHQTIGQIDEGLLVFFGAAKGDTPLDIDYLVEKIPNLRIFSDDEGKMNRSLMDMGGKLFSLSRSLPCWGTHASWQASRS